MRERLLQKKTPCNHIVRVTLDGRLVEEFRSEAHISENRVDEASSVVVWRHSQQY